MIVFRRNYLHLIGEKTKWRLLWPLPVSVSNSWCNRTRSPPGDQSSSKHNRPLAHFASTLCQLCVLNSLQGSRSRWLAYHAFGSPPLHIVAWSSCDHYPFCRLFGFYGIFYCNLCVLILLSVRIHRRTVNDYSTTYLFPSKGHAQYFMIKFQATWARPIKLYTMKGCMKCLIKAQLYLMFWLPRTYGMSNESTRIEEKNTVL